MRQGVLMSAVHLAAILFMRGGFMPKMEKDKQNSPGQPEQFEEYTSPQKGQNRPGVKPAQSIRKDSDTPAERHDGQTENY